MKVIERYPLFLKIVRGKGFWKILFPGLLAFSFLYGLGVLIAERIGRANKHKYRGRLREAGGAVAISIGNIEVGGSGKTPCAMALYQALRATGAKPVVVSRGYGGSLERSGPYALFEDALPRGIGYPADATSLADIAARFGDEVAQYRMHKIPVVVDADRDRGIKLAVAQSAATHIILDDAFQCFSLVKDIDILLLDAEEPFGNGLLLPAGRLREWPASARRADVVIFTRARNRTVPKDAARYLTGKPVFFAHYNPVCLVGANGARRDLSVLRGSEVVAVSGIGRPESFEDSLARLSGSLRMAYRFKDHYLYTKEDLEFVFRSGNDRTVFVTTEKDLVKIAPLLDAVPDVYALEVELKIDDLESLVSLIENGK